MTKQELIQAYQYEYKLNYQIAVKHRDMAANATDMMDAAHYDQMKDKAVLVASMCKQFVKNLEEMDVNVDE